LPGLLWFGTGLNESPDRNPYMVEGFAAKSKECLSQIKIINYSNRGTFFIGFRAKQVEPKME